MTLEPAQQDQQEEHGAQDHAQDVEQRDERDGDAQHQDQASQALTARAASGPGSLERKAPSSSRLASTAITRPSQNGRKPDPGPFGPQ